MILGGATGTTITSNLVAGNRGDGVQLAGGATANWIGVNPVNGPENAAQRNIITGNGGNGVNIGGAGTTGNVVAGNYIGLYPSGLAALGNRQAGVRVDSGATGTIIGGVTPVERNVISGNTTYGIAIFDPGTNANLVEGNYMGTDASGTGAIANGQDGVIINGSAYNNTIGGLTGTPGTGLGNIISGNSGHGLTIGDGASGNVVEGNSEIGRGSCRG